MSESSDLRTAKERVTRVFRYLQQMHQVRTPPAVQIDAREWQLLLDDLPESSHLLRGYELGASGSAGQAGSLEYVMKVRRPKETECPEPSIVIKNWLRPGWDQVDADPESIVKKTRKNSAGASETFSDSEDRIAALSDFQDAKKVWESEERGAIDSLGVFQNLFELHVKLQRESEKYQLFLADGILVMDHPGGQVNHPVLLQRVELRFDAAVPEFSIVDSEDNPELYTPLLRHVGLDGDGIRTIADAVAREHTHPLGTESTTGFLRDFIQRFWTDGQFFEDELSIENPAGPYLYRRPQLYLGSRNHGLVENLERYIESLPDLPELPESLYRVVGIETGRSEEREEDDAPIDILLTKHANAEQVQVIRRLEETGAVIVQGPPGTGKSHTIANLIGHLLAQNKSILVTSHASKALRVVREHLAKPLQSLCVSVLESDEESSRQLEESITGIVNYLASTSEKKLERDIERLTERRSALCRDQEMFRTRLLAAVKGEYEDLEALGEGIAPSEAARKIGELAGIDDWIPGPLPDGAEPPLPAAELEELYSLNAELRAEDEKFFNSDFPDLDALPSSKDFAELYDQLAELERTNLKTGAEFWLHEDQEPEALQALLDSLTHAADILEHDEGAEFLYEQEEWVRDGLEAGRAGGERAKSWRELIEMIDECGREVLEREPLTLEHGPRIDSEKSLVDLIRTCNAILEHLAAGKQLSKLSLLRRHEWSDLIRCSGVDDGTPKDSAHFRAILYHLEIRSFRNRLAQRWDRQMAPLGAPAFSALGQSPEKAARRYAAGIALALDWHPHVWTRCEEQLERAGLDWNRLARKAAGRKSETDEFRQVRELVTDTLGPLIETRRRFLSWRALGKRKDAWQSELASYTRKDGVYALVKQMRSGIRKGNYDTYSTARARLSELTRLRPGFARRLELLEKLQAVASGWAEAVRERVEPHARGSVPGDVERAWWYRQWEQHLTRQAEVDLDKLQESLDTVTEQLFGVTADYVEKLSWLAQLRRTGLQQQQALNGWLGLHKKIGKGTGKHVARLKEEAQRTLVECRNAVPVWIMPLSRVVECFDFATTRFDVVIIDEASQSDVMGLVAFALGKEVVVVGYHEQVSPYAIGQRSESIRAIIDEILLDIPNNQLYDGKTSVYDLARQSFGATIRLVEHFRCVPDIIQFSNQLCYGGEIRALREDSASRIRPHLVCHRVKTAARQTGSTRTRRWRSRLWSPRSVGSRSTTTAPSA